MMFRVFTSAFAWSAGPWRTTAKQLSKARATFFQEARQHLRVHRIWGETDAAFARRQALAYRAAQRARRLPDVDVYILSRIYDYVGRAVRAGARDANSLQLKFMQFRDESWRAQSQRILKHQQHPVRTPPWTWEYMFSKYFRNASLEWQEVVANKLDWKSHRKSRIVAMFGPRSSKSEFGRVQ